MTSDENQPMTRSVGQETGVKGEDFKELLGTVGEHNAPKKHLPMSTDNFYRDIISYASCSSVSTPEGGDFLCNHGKCKVLSSGPRHRKSRALVEDYTQGKKTFSSTGVDVQKPQAVFEEELYLRLISLQKADGSWDLDESLCKVLDMSLENIMAAHPAKHLDASAWATILAVIWLHANCSSWKWEWELLEKKAIAWVRPYAGSSMSVLVKAAIALLKVYVNPVIFDL
ncbi:von Willebrand factor A domain-containing protein 5A-like [Ochotona princeps]|uniref:von Willebrand factor A domain-containing protein 5A-like n=1 Tax=Ochotona princeps TaxID=9978 RepID=UPI00271450A0|nr:von Willebrand factor A domain-containing protein 5A-like [Ochotona princeps]